MDTVVCSVLYIVVIATFGTTFSTGNIEVGSSNNELCIRSDITGVNLTCSANEPPASLQWELNGKQVTGFCAITDTDLQGQVEVIDCSTANGIFDLRINDISPATEGHWTCRYNSTAYGEVEAMMCTIPSGDDPQPNSQSSRSGAGKTTLKYEQSGCYFPAPIFRWYDENYKEITEEINTYLLSGSDCPSPQVAMGSSCTVDFPGWFQERNYTCEVYFQGIPDFVVNSKTFTVSTDQCIAECVVLPIVAVAAIVVGVVVYKKKQKKNKNTTF